ncbi:MAG: hypothetical protein GEU74_07960 [Nitriliruptorales bacterium]|nr:hypothetical protein [Nitriliruptorales bacterium]
MKRRHLSDKAGDGRGRRSNPGLLAVAAQAKQARPVFIVGEARSGTSILYRTLQKHPSFRPRTVNLVETDIFAHLRRTFMFKPSYPESLVRFMLDDSAAYADFLRSIRLPRAVSAVSAGPNYLLRNHPADWLWYANLSHLVVRSYFSHATRARGCARLVEKTPTNSPHLKKLTRAFPRAQLLYIHRHPLDVFSSFRRRAAADPNAQWAQLTPAQFCHAFGSSTRRVLEWIGSGHPNLLLFGYEDFTRHPAETFERICAFLEEPFVEQAVEEHAPNPRRWRVDPHLWSGIVAETKSWTDYMTQAEARIIERRLRPEMAALAYEPRIAG